MQKENDIEKYLVKRMKDLGALCFKWTSPGTRGVPDRIVIYKGIICFVELKAPGKKPRPDQELMHKKLRNQRARVYVINSKDEVISFKRFLENSQEVGYERRHPDFISESYVSQNAIDPLGDDQW